MHNPTISPLRSVPLPKPLFFSLTFPACLCKFFIFDVSSSSSPQKSPSAAGWIITVSISNDFDLTACWTKKRLPLKLLSKFWKSFGSSFWWKKVLMLRQSLLSTDLLFIRDEDLHALSALHNLILDFEELCVILFWLCLKTVLWNLTREMRTMVCHTEHLTSRNLLYDSCWNIYAISQYCLEKETHRQRSNLKQQQLSIIIPANITLVIRVRVFVHQCA